jgi:hypothetical protein
MELSTVSQMVFPKQAVRKDTANSKRKMEVILKALPI